MCLPDVPLEQDMFEAAIACIFYILSIALQADISYNISEYKRSYQQQRKFAVKAVDP